MNISAKPFSVYFIWTEAELQCHIYIPLHYFRFSNLESLDNGSVFIVGQFLAGYIFRSTHTTIDDNVSFDD